MGHLLAVDVGRQSLKACVVDRQLATLETATVPYAPDVRSGNHVEIDPEVLWIAFIRDCGNHGAVPGSTVDIHEPSLANARLPKEMAGDEGGGCGWRLCGVVQEDLLPGNASTGFL